jgi:hypothetical protein
MIGYTKRTMAVIAVLLIAMIFSTAVNAQEEVPQPPVPLEEGQYLINPNPGIAAPEPVGEVGTMSVSGSRGYGDVTFRGAYYNPFTAWTDATTWLENYAPGTHNLCAQIVTVDVDGIGRGGTSYTCGSYSPGGGITVTHAVSIIPGQFIAARSQHQISSTSYNWGPVEDADAMTW